MSRPSRPLPRLLLPLLAAALLAPPARGLDLDLVLVADPGNAPDTQIMNCCDSNTGTTGLGSVPYPFYIGRTEVSVAEWVELLNAVGADDPHGLYNDGNGDRFMSIWVDRTGSPGSYDYGVVPGTGNLPIGFIDFFDALRFANWLHNGQPSGAQDATSTEDGAYTLTGTFTPFDVARNPDALYFVPNNDEWYKAAFHEPFTDTYHRYAFGGITPIPEPPPGVAGSANFASPVACLPEDEPIQSGPCMQTPVGAYTASASPWGTFDQGGNHLEWLESQAVDPAEGRVFRGGWWPRGLGDLDARNMDRIQPEIQNAGGLGFRVAPEPGAVAQLVLGGTILWGVKRRRARRCAPHAAA